MAFVYLLVFVLNNFLVFCEAEEGTISSVQKFTVCKNHYASSRIKDRWNTRRVFYCYFHCGRNSWCRALTIKPVPGGVECTFHSGFVDVTCNSFPLLDNVGYRLLLKNIHYSKEDSGEDDDCVHGISRSDGCKCTDGFTGEKCDRYFYDCKETLDRGLPLDQSDLTPVMVKPQNADFSFEALCNRYGQIAIFARNTMGHNTVAFNKSWEEYKHPFGEVGNFWLGLKHIYALLNQGDNFKLQIYCSDGTKEFSVFYETFTIQSENDQYQMTSGPKISDPSTENSDGFGGGNSNVPFCTYDKQCNGGYPNNLNGGWWYVSGLEDYALTNHKSSLKFRYLGNDFPAHKVSMSLEKLPDS